MRRVHRFFFDRTFDLIRGLVWIYFSVFHGLRLCGLHHLPKSGPYVIAPNHQSSLDGFLAGFRVPGRVHCVVERPYFRRGFAGFMLRNFRGLPLSAGRDRRGYEGILETLRQGHPVVIFPEGRRSLDGESVFKIQTGAARVALSLGVPIVPMTLLGVFETLPRGSHFPRLFQPIVAKYHPPILCPATSERDELKERIEGVNLRLETRYRRRLKAWKRYWDRNSNRNQVSRNQSRG